MHKAASHLSRALKTVFTTIFALVALIAVNAPSVHAAPGVRANVTYQARLMDASGYPVADGVYQVRFSLYDAAVAGTRLWTAAGTTVVPTPVNVSVQDGLFTVLLGDGVTQLPFGDLDWNSDSLYLGVTIGADGEMSPRRPITAVPQAINSSQLSGMSASSSDTWGGQSQFAITQASTTAATSTRSALDVRSNGTSVANDFILRAIGSTGVPLFTVNSQGTVSTTDLLVDGIAVCRADGTDCLPVASGTSTLQDVYEEGNAITLNNNALELTVIASGTNLLPFAGIEGYASFVAKGFGQGGLTLVHASSSVVPTTTYMFFTSDVNDPINATSSYIASQPQVGILQIAAANELGLSVENQGNLSLQTIGGNIVLTANTTTFQGNIVINGGSIEGNANPFLDNAYSLGNSSFRWNGYFASVTTTNLSVAGQSVCLEDGTNCANVSLGQAYLNGQTVTTTNSAIRLVAASTTLVGTDEYHHLLTGTFASGTREGFDLSLFASSSNPYLAGTGTSLTYRQDRALAPGATTSSGIGFSNDNSQNYLTLFAVRPGGQAQNITFNRGGINIFPSVNATTTFAQFVALEYGARVDSDLIPRYDDLFTLGTSTARWNGIFANVTTTNLNVGGQSVCLADGTNCLVAGTSSDWTYDAANGLTRLTTTTNDVVIGSAATSTGAPVYVETNSAAGTSTLFVGYNTSSNVIIGGTSSTFDFMHAEFSGAFDGNDLFVGGNIGAASSVYTNGEFVVGNASMHIGNGYINKTDGDLSLISGNGDIVVSSWNGIMRPTTDQGVTLGSATERFNGNFGSISANTLNATSSNVYNSSVQRLDYFKTNLQQVGTLSFAAISGATTVRMDINDHQVAVAAINGVSGGVKVFHTHIQGSSVLNDTSFTIAKPFIRDLSITRNRLYLLNAGTNQLEIHGYTSVSDTGMIGSVGGFDFSTSSAIVIKGNFAYIGDNGKLRVVDISSDTNPRIVFTTVGTISLGTYDMAVDGRWLAMSYEYILGGVRSYRFNISDPLNVTGPSFDLSGINPTIGAQDGTLFTIETGGTFVTSRSIENPGGNLYLGCFINDTNLQARLTVSGQYVFAAGQDLNVVNTETCERANLVNAGDSGSVDVGTTGYHVFVASTNGIAAYDFGGFRSPAADFGETRIGNAFISNDLDVYGQGYFGQGLQVAAGGASINGGLSVDGYLSLMAATNSSGYHGAAFIGSETFGATSGLDIVSYASNSDSGTIFLHRADRSIATDYAELIMGQFNGLSYHQLTLEVKDGADENDINMSPTSTMFGGDLLPSGDGVHALGSSVLNWSEAHIVGVSSTLLSLVTGTLGHDYSVGPISARSVLETSHVPGGVEGFDIANFTLGGTVTGTALFTTANRDAGAPFGVAGLSGVTSTGLYSYHSASEASDMFIFSQANNQGTFIRMTDQDITLRSGHGVSSTGGLIEFQGVSTTAAGATFRNATSSPTNQNWDVYARHAAFGELKPGNIYASGTDTYGMYIGFAGTSGVLCLDEVTTAETCPTTPLYSIVSEGGINAFDFDLAEMYAVSGTVSAGDVVILAEDGMAVEQSQGIAYDRRAIGVVSTEPGFVLGRIDGGSPIALAGRVPTKVSVGNGVIKAGDRLATSPIAGVAMKATRAGQTIGIALEDANVSGIIEVFIQPSFDLSSSIGTDGSLIFTNENGSTTFSVDAAGNGYFLGDVSATSFTTHAAFDLAEQYLSADALEPGDIVVASPNGNMMIQRSADAKTLPMGIISSAPGFVLGAKATGTHPVALAGRVPTKVSTINGEIKSGDLLAPTDIPGVAGKAFEDGPVVGIALEDYNGADIGKIEVFVKSIWYSKPNEAVAQVIENNTYVTNVTTSTPDVVRRGLAKIETGAVKVHVSFETLNGYPFVQATPRGLIVGAWSTDNYSDTGFDLVLEQPQTFDVVFGWEARALDGSTMMTMSDGTSLLVDPTTGQVIVQEAEPITEPTPEPAPEPTPEQAPEPSPEPVNP